MYLFNILYYHIYNIKFPLISKTCKHKRTVNITNNHHNLKFFFLKFTKFVINTINFLFRIFTPSFFLQIHSINISKFINTTLIKITLMSLILSRNNLHLHLLEINFHLISSLFRILSIFYKNLLKISKIRSIAKHRFNFKPIRS